MRRRLLTSVLSLTAAALAQDPAPLRGRLRTIHVATGDVFAPDFTERYPLAGLVNALHWRTREDVVRREIWFVPGDFVDADLAAELERNLRALDLFAEVAVRVVPTATPGEVDLEVVTRDRLTLSVGAGASYVGGVTGLNATIGESNLFGVGDRIAASFRRNSDGEYRGGLTYTDLQVLDSWHRGTVHFDRTDEGNSFGLDLRRPFHHLADPRAWSAGFGHAETEVDYYRGGDSVAAVPDVHASVRGDMRWGSGPVDGRRTVGVTAEFDRHDYDPAIGPFAPAIRVPGDTESTFVGLTGSWQHVTGYRKVEGLDTLVYVQDLTLGVAAGATFGARWRDERGRRGELQPELRAHVGWAAEPVTDLFTNVDLRGSVREADGEAVGWYTTASVRTFAMLGERHTLAARAVFDAVEETQDLPVELTLGADSGLRGYPTREFAGARRLRTNLEHRFDTGLELATLHFGLVAFFDSGWAGDDRALGRPFASAGGGLRIGTKPLLGGGVLRVDLAYPLDDVPGESDGWKLSVSVGQVFGFGG